MALPEDLLLEPLQRRPLQLPPATVERVMAQPIPIRPQQVASPAATIVMVTYGNIACTRMAVASVLVNTTEPIELIVVDNASTDGTGDYLQEVARRNPGVIPILNDENRGFAAANNQALIRASAPVLVLLNNDTVVPPGWLSRLLAHLESSQVGAVGPVTNRIGNEAEIRTSYRTYGEMVRVATQRSREHDGENFDIDVLMMFCFAMRQDTFSEVGLLDEQFGVGTLEDDDYSRRVRLSGRRVICAEDAFVHHFGQASFASLIADGTYAPLQQRNREYFEAKWGAPWTGYQRRADSAYDHLCSAVSTTVAEHVPAGATVAVISRGDDTLVDLPDRAGRHFPADEAGGYAGNYPRSAADAVQALRQAQQAGVEYLVVPATSAWWLAHYDALGALLRPHAVIETHECSIFRLDHAL